MWTRGHDGKKGNGGLGREGDLPKVPSEVVKDWTAGHCPPSISGRFPGFLWALGATEPGNRDPTPGRVALHTQRSREDDTNPNQLKCH